MRLDCVRRLWIAGVAAFAACTAPSDVKAVERPIHLHDGLFTVEFTNGTVAAQGQLVDGRQSGPWRYWYDDGQLFLQGAFGEGALCNGPWILFHREGGVDWDSTSAIRCDGFSTVSDPAGDWDWTSFDIEQRRALRGLTPGLFNGWDGTGFYDNGVKVRPLSKSEAERLRER